LLWKNTAKITFQSKAKINFTMLDYLLNNELLPHFIIRWGIDHQLKHRLITEQQAYTLTQGENKQHIIDSLKQSHIALSTATANQQHYEVPTAFFQYVLGPFLKYSACYYKTAKNLKQAELDMLDLYCKRAQITNGQSILDLGCGWGSLSLYLAEKFPQSQITGLSNSSTQKAYIDEIAQQRNYPNLKIITADINTFSFKKGQFDRILSIEMFEHIRNYAALLNRLSEALTDQGKLFVHHFCHRQFIYPFNEEDSWMAKHFFKDGLMLSEDTLLFFQEQLLVEQRWRVNGKHYAKTCYAWLDNLFKNKQAILALFREHYKPEEARLYYQYWHLFIRACAQLFDYRQGEEWFVSHYLFRKRND